MRPDANKPPIRQSIRNAISMVNQLGAQSPILAAVFEVTSKIAELKFIPKCIDPTYILLHDAMKDASRRVWVIRGAFNLFSSHCMLRAMRTHS